MYIVRPPRAATDSNDLRVSGVRLPAGLSALQGFELGQQPVARVGAGHPHKLDLAAQPGPEVRDAAPILAIQPLEAGAVKDRAEPLDLGPQNAGPIIDDETGNHLRPVATLDARLAFVDDKSLFLRDVTNSGEQIANATFKALVA
jgi:hypothetical protein